MFNIKLLNDQVNVQDQNVVTNTLVWYYVDSCLSACQTESCFISFVQAVKPR